MQRRGQGRIGIRAGLVAALAAALTMLAACGGNAGSSQASHTLIVATDMSSLVTLDPNQSYEQLTYDRQLYTTLLTFDKADTSKVVKAAVDSWSMSSDAMTWTFRLKHGLKFSNGDPLTASDFVYSFQRVVNLPKNPAAWLVTQMGITADNVTQQVVASDPYTLTIKLTQPIAPGAFLDIMTFPTTAAVDAKVVKAHETGGDWGHAWLDSHAAGSGPYTLNRWDRNSQIVLDANPRYDVGPKPTMSRVIFKDVTESSTQFDLLQKGGADIVQDLTHQQIQQIQSGSKYHVATTPDLSLWYLGMDVKNVPAFGNPLVRQAVKYAIDYKGIVNDLVGGDAIENQGFVPKGMMGYDGALPYSQDVAKAKQLLQQAGYGSGFSFDMLIQTADITGIPSSDIASKIKSDLAKVGITVNPRQIQASQLYTIMRAQQAQAVFGNWSADYPDPDDFAKPFGDYGQKSLAWRLNWNDPSLSRMVDTAGTLPNGTRRTQLYHQINEYGMKESPFAVIYQPLLRDVMTSQVKGFYDNPVSGIDLLTIHK
jgi:peptide/nickel transport system substrate-binding protein